MAKEFFKAHFFPDEHGRTAWLTNSLNYYLSALFFNAFPLPQREAGARQTLRYIGEVLEDGFSVLIFPEGRRSDSGDIDRFRPGIGMIASRLNVPVVPVRIEGLDKVLHHTWRMARPGPRPRRVRRAADADGRELRSARASRGRGGAIAVTIFQWRWGPTLPLRSSCQYRATGDAPKRQRREGGPPRGRGGGTDADASPRIRMSSARHGRRRGLLLALAAGPHLPSAGLRHVELRGTRRSANGAKAGRRACPPKHRRCEGGN